MRKRVSRALWPLALALLLVACPSSKRKDTTNAQAPGDASAVDTPAASLLGVYECRWQREAQDLSAACEIATKGDAQHFSMSLEAGELTGVAKSASFGFHFVGTFTASSDSSEHPLDVEFLSQGAGAYAAVLPLGDGSLVKLNLQKPSS